MSFVDFAADLTRGLPGIKRGVATLRSEPKTPQKPCEKDFIENSEKENSIEINKRYDKILENPMQIVGEYESTDSHKALGGGVSGAYIFLKTNKKSFARKNILKIYLDAINPYATESLSYVQNSRPFREVRTLELLSSFWKIKSIKTGICFIDKNSVKVVKTEQIDKYFERDAKTIIKPHNPDKDFDSEKADARSIPRFPTYALTVEMPLAPGIPLFQIEPTDCVYFGAVLQLLVVWEQFTQALPNGCHWDLHPNNIFVNKERNIRPSFEIEYDDNFTVEAPTEGEAVELEQRRANDREKVLRLLDPYKKRVQSPESRLFSSLFGVENVKAMIRQIKKGRRQNTKTATVLSPEITLIDFDLVTFDYPGMSELTEDHKRKINTPGGIGYDLYAWLLKRLPRSAVVVLVGILEVKKNSFPAHNKVDWCHILCYVAVAICYNFSKIWGKGMDLVTHGFCVQLNLVCSKLKDVKDIKRFLIFMQAKVGNFKHLKNSYVPMVPDTITSGIELVTMAKSMVFDSFKGLVEQTISFNSLIKIMLGILPRIQRAAKGLFFDTADIADFFRRVLLTLIQIPDQEDIEQLTIRSILNFYLSENTELFDGKIWMGLKSFSKEKWKNWGGFIYNIGASLASPLLLSSIEENDMVFLEEGSKIDEINLGYKSRTVTIESGPSSLIKLSIAGSDGTRRASVEVKKAKLVIGPGKMYLLLTASVEASALTQSLTRFFVNRQSGKRFKPGQSDIDVNIPISNEGKGAIPELNFIQEVLSNTTPTVETTLDLFSKYLSTEESAIKIIEENGKLGDVIIQLKQCFTNLLTNPSNVKIELNTKTRKPGQDDPEPFSVNLWGHEEMEPEDLPDALENMIGGRRYIQRTSSGEEILVYNAATDQMVADYYPFKTLLLLLGTFFTQGIDVFPALYVLANNLNLENNSDKKEAQNIKTIVTYSLLESISEDTVKARTMPIQTTLEIIIKTAGTYFNWNTREEVAFQMLKQPDFYNIAYSTLYHDIVQVQPCDKKSSVCKPLLKHLKESLRDRTDPSEF